MKILIPVDGSNGALDAVRHALRLRREGLAASFLLATVLEPSNLYGRIQNNSAELQGSTKDAAGAIALKGAEALFMKAGVLFEREIASGSAAFTLIEIVERHGCDAIVMSARGKGALSNELLGSVARAVLYASMVPVTLVKHAQVNASL